MEEFHTEEDETDRPNRLNSCENPTLDLYLLVRSATILKRTIHSKMIVFKTTLIARNEKNYQLVNKGSGLNTRYLTLVFV